jgi:hypothetical protein
MVEEELWDYLTPSMPLQDAELLACTLLEPSPEAESHRIGASYLACDEGKMSPGSKRPRRD